MSEVKDVEELVSSLTEIPEPSLSVDLEDRDSAFGLDDDRDILEPGLETLAIV